MLGTQSNLPWLCGGNFNEILLKYEKNGGVGRRNQAMQNFRDTMNLCNLKDVGYEGYPFTWTNGREGDDNIQERLDRFLANEDWLNLFPSVKVIHEPRSFSDHCPVLLDDCETRMVENRPGRRPFRFQEAWTKEETCDKLVEAAWIRDGEAVENIKKCEECFLIFRCF